jgi:DNA-directed RNA polymerase specialized sigma24 family protein
MLLVDRYSRSPKFNRYSYKEDMKAEALINLCNRALTFDPNRTSNPFAFYTTAIHNSFIQFLNNEKKQRNIRDKLLIEAGELPSYNDVNIWID